MRLAAAAMTAVLALSGSAVPAHAGAPEGPAFVAAFAEACVPQRLSYPGTLDHAKSAGWSEVAENAHPELDAVLAGRGSLADELAASADRLGIRDRLAMPGFVSDDALVELLRQATAVVYAPYDEDYGFVTLQAFLAGVPVVTTDDSGGVLEWVVHEETGLVTDGSPAAMGAALDRLVADPALARRLGAAGRDRVKDLSWDHVVSTLLGGTPS